MSVILLRTCAGIGWVGDVITTTRFDATHLLVYGYASIVIDEEPTIEDFFNPNV